MDLQTITETAADIEREYLETIAPALTDLAVKTEELLRAARQAQDQGWSNGTDDAYKNARQAFDAVDQEAARVVAAARGVRTKALKKAGLQ